MLLVAEFDDPVEDLRPVRVGKLDPELRQVVVQRCLSRELAQGVAAFASEALRRQARGVEIALGVAVGVYTGRLREDIGAENRRVRGNVLAAEGLHQFGNRRQPGFVDVGAELRVVCDGRHDFGQRRIAGALAQSVHAGVDAGGAGLNRRDGVGRGQAIVVVAVKVEDAVRPGDGHQADKAAHVVGRKNAEGVRQQNPLHFQPLQRIDQAPDVVEAVSDAVGPVLQVDIDTYILLSRVIDGFDDFLDMLPWRHAQLFAAVSLRALRQEIDDPSAGIADPVHRAIDVTETEHLHPADQARRAGPRGDALRPLQFAPGSARGDDLDPVDAHIVEQHAGHVKLFGRRIGDSRGLLAIPERRIHDGYRFCCIAGHRLAEASLSCRRTSVLPKSLAKTRPYPSTSCCGRRNTPRAGTAPRSSRISSSHLQLRPNQSAGRSRGFYQPSVTMVCLAFTSLSTMDVEASLTAGRLSSSASRNDPRDSRSAATT